MSMTAVMSIKCVEIKPNNELDKLLCDYALCPIRNGFCEFGEEKTVLPAPYKKIADQIEHFDVRETDIFVISYPKTGTTWCQEMVWMIASNLNFEKGKVVLQERFPFLEFPGLYDFETGMKLSPTYKPPEYVIKGVDYIKNISDNPRFIKTHLPWNLLPKKIKEKTVKPKIIYVTRNAKDTCTSYFYHCILKEGYSGDFETFCKLFLSGRVNYGQYWTSVRDFWTRRNEPNILFITYEEMKQDLVSIIKKTATFLEKSLTEDQIAKLTNHLSFESMKNNNSVNYSSNINRQFYNSNAEGLQFLRSGTVGSYKAVMTPEMIQTFDQWIKDQCEKINIPIIENK